MIQLFTRKKYPRINVQETRKGQIEIRCKQVTNADKMLALIYATCDHVAKIHKVDVRFFIKKLLEVDKIYNKQLKQANETRPYKKKRGPNYSKPKKRK